MNTTTQINNSPMLGNVLQERLKLELPHSDPLLVQCIVKDGALMVLVQHPAEVELDPDQTFTVLEQAVLAERPEISPQVKLYLRLEGQQRPYAFHRFALELPPISNNQDIATDAEYTFDKLVIEPPVIANVQDFGLNERVTDAPVAYSQNLSALENPFKWGEIPQTETTLENEITDTPEVNLSTSLEENLSTSLEENLSTSLEENLSASLEENLSASLEDSEAVSQHADIPASVEESKAAYLESDLSASLEESEADEYIEQSTSTNNLWNEPVLESDLPSEALTNKTPRPVKPRRKPLSLPLPLVGTFVGISIVFFGTSLYALTRPCVVGSCTAMTDAQQLHKKSTQTLQYPSSGKEIIQARTQLKTAISNLESVPAWSTHHHQAQELLKNYQIEATRLDSVIAALSKADKASQKSKTLPLSESNWIEVQKLWRETLQELEQVPKNSTVYKLAQQKQKVYKANLAIINKRLTAEQQANKTILVSKDTARVAEAKSNVADSLESWQLVNNSWQTAVKKLEQIPPGTTAYTEAQQLLRDYQPKLADARDRQTQEQFAANAYRQSMSFAAQARRFQAENQWSQAVINWRNSLNYAKQVPNSSFYYNKTLLLINSFSDGLRQAETQLRVATVNQQARKELNQACAGVPQACTYTMANNVIKVKITPAYMQSVQQSALSAKMRGDYTAQTMVYNHVVTLSQALKVISNNVGNRLEIYTPDGVLRESHPGA